VGYHLLKGCRTVTDLELIMQAVTTGAGIVASSVAAPAVEDAYAALKARIRQHLTGRRLALEELEAHTPDPVLLRGHLVGTTAATDPDVHALAKTLLDLVDARSVNHVTVNADRAAHSINPGVNYGPITVNNHNHPRNQPEEPHRPPTPAVN
jgi:hypothetical protein